MTIQISQDTRELAWCDTCKLARPQGFVGPPCVRCGGIVRPALLVILMTKGLIASTAEQDFDTDVSPAEDN